MYHSSWLYWYSTVRDIGDNRPTTFSPFLLRFFTVSYHLCLWLYCISITKMSDTCTLSQLSPVWLYCISITKMIEYMYHSSWLYWYSTVRDIGDNRSTTFSPFLLRFFTVNYALRLNLNIRITKMSDTCTLSQLSPMSLTVLNQYHQDEWYLYSITVITCLTVLYQYHQDEWYLYSIIVITYVSDYTVRVQVSLILVILIQYSQRHRW
jgi:hypothetical protein